MLTVLETITFAFFIGLTGALAPGPTLVATIQSSLDGGWIAGPKVALGHILIETLVFILILIGVTTIALQFSGAIALVGGIALTGFGILTIREGMSARSDLSLGGATGNPYLAGILTGVTNPYFWIWWLTLGSVLLLDAMRGGWYLGIAFMAGHWAADVGWLTLVSTGIHRGRTILSSKGYRVTLVLCGMFLSLFGVFYLKTAFTGG
jgi:threonine/homoserine/homoserine lactone efflux protein